LTSRKLKIIDITALSLFLGGGVSNFYDRATNSGAVIDFLNIGVGSFRTGIFNVADMAIMLGAAILLFVSFKQQKDKSRTSDQSLQ
jgi:signal peptidase II